MAEPLSADVFADSVRRADPDRYFSSLFAPPAERALLNALYALNLELARVAEQVREPMLGQIRLQWWRETLEEARAGRPRNHDIARMMAAAFARHELPAHLFDAMIDARAAELAEVPFADTASLESYLDATSGNLIRIAARMIGARETPDAAAREAGLAYGLSGLLRAVPYHAKHGRSLLPDDLVRANDLTRDDILGGSSGARLASLARGLAARARSHFDALRSLRVPGSALAAFLPAALVPLYLKRLARARFDPFLLTEVPIHRRQMALLRASLMRRV